MSYDEAKTLFATRESVVSVAFKLMLDVHKDIVHIKSDIMGILWLQYCDQFAGEATIKDIQDIKFQHAAIRTTL